MIPTKTEIDRAFAWWLVDYVEKNCLTQFQAAINLGLYPSLVGLIMKGKKKPPRDTIERAFAKLGLDYGATLAPYLKKVIAARKGVNLND